MKFDAMQYPVNSIMCHPSTGSIEFQWVVQAALEKL